ncbi:PAS domain-containing protein [Methylobacterium radiodurans]|uniref:PAS domain-containing protein n=1 Tax=Methylobacterium radiodurans TaxID=2202828 RepID=UPI0019525358|nr:PAS domain-containing protein [Methylobacterium radiodurans]
MNSSTIEREEIDREIAALLQHPALRKAPKLSAFLGYIVRESLSGRGARLKAYTIATQALGRPADFDPVTDAIVRVEARRLRRVLDTIYAEPGCASTIRVELPRGHYDPVFRRVDATSPATRAIRAPDPGESLHESEQRYLALVRASAVIEWRAAPDGRVTHSYGWTERTGQEPETFAGSGWLDALHLDDRSRTVAAWAAARRVCAPLEIAYRVRHLDGGYRWMLARGVPVENADGSIREWVGTIVDAPEPGEPGLRVRDVLASARRLGTIYEILRSAQGEASQGASRRVAEERRLADGLRRHGLFLGQRPVAAAGPSSMTARVCTAKT